MKKAPDITRRCVRGASHWYLICVVGGGEGADREGVRHLARPPHVVRVRRRNLI